MLGHRRLFFLRFSTFFLVLWDNAKCTKYVGGKNEAQPKEKWSLVQAAFSLLLTCSVVQLGQFCSAQSEHCVNAEESFWAVLLLHYPGPPIPGSCYCDSLATAVLLVWLVMLPVTSAAVTCSN